MESLVSQSGYIATHANAFAVWHGIGERTTIYYQWMHACCLYVYSLNIVEAQSTYMQIRPLKLQNPSWISDNGWALSPAFQARCY